jgi:hypothetical protein
MGIGNSPDTYRVSPAKAQGLQPVYVYNDGKGTESFHVHLYQVLPQGSHCTLSDAPVSWASVTPTDVTVKPGMRAQATVTVHGMPAGTHDLGVAWEVTSRTDSGALAMNAVASQLILGHGGQVIACNNPREPVGAPVGDSTGISLMPGIAALIAVAAIAVALKRIFGRPNGAHRAG